MDPAIYTLLLSLIVVGMVIGLVGQVVVFFPGINIIWLSILGYGLLAGFTVPGAIVFFIITLLLIAGTMADNILMGATARQSGASWWAIGISMVAMLVVGLIWTPLAGLVASFAAIFVVEWFRIRDWRKALDSTRSAFIGCGLAAVMRFGASLLMIGLWLIWFLFLTPR